jgi:hypothetical protein
VEHLNWSDSTDKDLIELSECTGTDKHTYTAQKSRMSRSQTLSTATHDSSELTPQESALSVPNRMHPGPREAGLRIEPGDQPSSAARPLTSLHAADR